MNIEKIDINDIKLNPNNPRVIRDEKFKKLVKSIQDFPEMLKLRPILVDENEVILGGNMRWKAAKEAGLKEVWITKVKLSEEKKKELIVKDNVNYGRWDYLLLKDFDALTEWGMDIPNWAIDKLNDNELDFGDDDFFNSDFFNGTDSKEAEFNSQEPEPPIIPTSNTTYFLLMFEKEDYDFIKGIENKLLQKTSTDNLSDAILKIIKQ